MTTPEGRTMSREEDTIAYRQFQRWLDSDNNKAWLLDLPEYDLYRLWKQGWCEALKWATKEIGEGHV